MITTYARARTQNQVSPGYFLDTLAQARLIHYTRRAKLARLETGKMRYKMRLGAMVAADNRKGKLWV